MCGLPRGIWHQGVVKTDVEMHWARIIGEGASRRTHSAQHHRVQPIIGREARRYTELPPGCRAENAGLHRCLVGPGVPHLCRTIRRDDDHRHSRRIGLGNRRMQIGHRRARRGDDGSRSTDLAQPQSHESSGSLVQTHREVQHARLIGGSKGIGERCITRSGADDDVGDAMGHQCRDDSAGDVG